MLTWLRVLLCCNELLLVVVEVEAVEVRGL